MVSAMNGAPQPALDALVVASVDSEDDELMAVASGAKAAPTAGARALGGNSLRSVHAAAATTAAPSNGQDRCHVEVQAQLCSVARSGGLPHSGSRAGAARSVESLPHSTSVSSNTDRDTKYRPTARVVLETKSADEAALWLTAFTT